MKKRIRTYLRMRRLRRCLHRSTGVPYEWGHGAGREPFDTSELNRRIIAALRDAKFDIRIDGKAICEEITDKPIQDDQ